MKIKMELLSDAIPGSGEGFAGIIDSDIVYDEFGIPYIPAKRLKGILKESARDIEDVGKLTRDRIDAIFGKSGSEKGTELKISDGYVADYERMRDFFKAATLESNYKEAAPVFNKEAVLGYYSYTRSQTTIDVEKGVAKEDMLRTFRILRRGLEFYFDVVCPHEYLEDFKKILKVTRAFGTSRTRGTGEIRLSLLNDESPESSTSALEEDNQFQDNDLCEVKLNLHNVAQLLVTSQVGKTQESEDYIPGSFILGALAGRYISARSLSVPHKDEDFRAIFLNGKVHFSDAHPNLNQTRVYWPCPNSLVKEKDKDNYFDLTDTTKIDDIIDKKIQTKGRIGSFVHFGGNEVEYVTTETEIEYHHQRPSHDRGIGHAKEEAGEFFQFNVIKPDQKFQAHIFGEYRYLKKLFSLLQQDNVLFLGKSKTAQYGKCMCEAEIARKSPSSKKWENGAEAVITLISDMILRNENGMTVADPDFLVREIREFLGYEKNSDAIQLVGSFTDAKKIGGYLGVWNMPKIQAVALAAGSEIICQNNTGGVIEAEKLESHSFGFRTEEGFGQVKVNWHNRMNIDNVKKGTIQYTLSEASTETRELVKYILDKELETAVINYAFEQFEKFKGASITNSFIGRLQLLVNRSNSFDELNRNIRFSKRAFEQLRNLKKYWFLSETKDDSGKEICAVNTDKFSRVLLEIQRPTNVAGLIKITGKLKIDRGDIAKDEDHQLKLYKIFANHFLTLARLHNRKQEVQNG